jgi:hypothetical protein
VWIQSTVITFGAIVPVVVNLQGFSVGAYDLTVPGRILATILSLAVAILTGLATFHKYGELWLAYRATEEHLKKEMFLYLTKSGDYSDPDTSFSRFVERIEGLVSSEHIKFQTLIEESRRPTEPAASDAQGGPSE